MFKVVYILDELCAKALILRSFQSLAVKDVCVTGVNRCIVRGMQMNFNKCS